MDGKGHETMCVSCGNLPVPGIPPALGRFSPPEHLRQRPGGTGSKRACTEKQTKRRRGRFCCGGTGDFPPTAAACVANPIWRKQFFAFRDRLPQECQHRCGLPSTSRVGDYARSFRRFLFLHLYSIISAANPPEVLPSDSRSAVSSVCGSPATTVNLPAEYSRRMQGSNV